jgi:hypothetical protein
MLIEWLIPMRTADLSLLRKSNLASIRLRTAIGAIAAEQQGAKNQFPDGYAAPMPNVIVVGKIDNISDPNRADRWIKRLTSQKSSAKIIIDYTDHHLARSTENACFYKAALDLCDHVVCSSRMLAQNLASHFKGPTSIIEDPIEVPILAPRKKGNTVSTALWFGHGSNLPYLIDFLCNGYSHSNPARLIAMTNLYPLPEELTTILNRPNLDNLEINVVPWSRDDMIQAAHLADMCWIPAGVTDPMKSGASSNRLLTALALGLPTAADPLDSYQSFSNIYMNLRSNEIMSAITNPAPLFEKVKIAQNIISKNFTSEKIQKKWETMIEKEIKHSIQYATS